MPTLIDRQGVRVDCWVRVPAVATAEGNASAAKAIAPLAIGAALLVPLARLLDEREHWLAHEGPLGVALGPADDPAVLSEVLPRLDLVAVGFPSFTDGRGYSIARLLRERLGYSRELRAVGDILRDQLFYLARCGFDSFALRDDQEVAEALTAFADFSEVYQAANDRGPLFARRFDPVPARKPVSAA